MTGHILLNDAGAGEASVRPRESVSLAGLVLPVGLAFLLAGGVDMALGWFPMAFGTPEWEFGTITQTLNGLPVPTLGLALVAVWGAATRRRWLVWTAGVVWVVGAVLVLAAGGLYALTVPVALKAVHAPLIRLGLKKAIVKSIVQVVVYAAAYLWLGALFLKRASTSSQVGKAA